VPESVVIRDSEGERTLRRRGQEWLNGRPLQEFGAHLLQGAVA